MTREAESNKSISSHMKVLTHRGPLHKGQGILLVVFSVRERTPDAIPMFSTRVMCWVIRGQGTSPWTGCRWRSMQAPTLCPFQVE